MPEDQRDDNLDQRQQSYALVRQFAESIQGMTEMQEGLMSHVKELGERTSTLSEMIDALGPIMVEIVALLKEYNVMLNEMTEGEGDGERENDIQKVEEGLLAALRAMRRGRG